MDDERRTANANDATVERNRQTARADTSARPHCGGGCHAGLVNLDSKASAGMDAPGIGPRERLRTSS
jgi:hypothetical protein